MMDSEVVRLRYVRLTAALAACFLALLIVASGAQGAPGDLTQKSGTEACVSETGTAGACTDGVGLDEAYSVTVSPDGKSAYVASSASSAVAVFDRNTTPPSRCLPPTPAARP